jgi:hypothetical protein
MNCYKAGTFESLNRYPQSKGLYMIANDYRFFAAITSRIRRKYTLSDRVCLAKEPNSIQDLNQRVPSDADGLVIFCVKSEDANAVSCFFTTRGILSVEKTDLWSFLPFERITDWKTNHPFGLGPVSASLTIHKAGGGEIKIRHLGFDDLSACVAILSYYSQAQLIDNE